MNSKVAHPVDVHVGKRLRQLRILSGLSQTDVSKALGISFQQIQKYERGVNRLSASKLYEISNLLSAPPSYFFAGLDFADDVTSISKETPEATEFTKDILSLIQHYNKLPNKEYRTAVLNLLKTATASHIAC